MLLNETSARSGIWLEFFEKRTILPPPFCVLHLVLVALGLLCRASGNFWLKGEDGQEGPKTECTK